jgi:hypothetical protein
MTDQRHRLVLKEMTKVGLKWSFQVAAFGLVFASIEQTLHLSRQQWSFWHTPIAGSITGACKYILLFDVSMHCVEIFFARFAVAGLKAGNGNPLSALAWAMLGGGLGALSSAVDQVADLSEARTAVVRERMPPPPLDDAELIRLRDANQRSQPSPPPQNK